VGFNWQAAGRLFGRSTMLALASLALFVFLVCVVRALFSD
jgi:hypothetical protein